jgi:hypothetical protein
MIEEESIPPIDKQCKKCGETKLLSEFDWLPKSEDKHNSICKACERKMQETDEESSCEGPGHTNSCVINKTLTVMYHELELFLIRVQNGLFVPPDIRELMIEIMKQNEINESKR